MPDGDNNHPFRDNEGSGGGVAVAPLTSENVQLALCADSSHKIFADEDIPPPSSEEKPAPLKGVGERGVCPTVGVSPEPMSEGMLSLRDFATAPVVTWLTVSLCACVLGLLIVVASAGNANFFVVGAMLVFVGMLSLVRSAFAISNVLHRRHAKH